MQPQDDSPAERQTLSDGDYSANDIPDNIFNDEGSSFKSAQTALPANSLNNKNTALSSQTTYEPDDLIRRGDTSGRRRLFELFSALLILAGSSFHYPTRNPVNSVKQLHPMLRISNAHQGEFSLAFDVNAVRTMKLGSLTLDVIVSSSRIPEDINAQVYYKGPWNGESRTPNIEFDVRGTNLQLNWSEPESIVGSTKLFVHAKPNGADAWWQPEEVLVIE